MEILQAFKFELRPNGSQKRSMAKAAGCKRVVYNKALALCVEKHADGEKRPGYGDLCRQLTQWRADSATAWLAESPVHTQQQALKDLDKAYKNFFEGRAKFPQFKRKGEGDSFRYPDPKQFKLDQGNGRVFLPKLGWMRYRMSRKVLGELRNITISQSCGKWFMSVQTRREVEAPAPCATAFCGIDMGIASFATLDSGQPIAGPNAFKKHEKNLAKYQRRMARKVKGSSNWKKAKKKVQRIQATIANVRKDFLHRQTRNLAKSHAGIAIEDLKVKNMSASAKGTLEEPGTNVASKSGLNKSILDQGWGMFRTMLEYKMERRGHILVAVPAMNTSRKCPKPGCGCVSKDNRKTQAKFKCVACGYEGHADHVAAINVREAGHASLACQARGESMPPATGTRRGERGSSSRAAVGIPALSAQAAAFC
jgi:putative transposase